MLNRILFLFSFLSLVQATAQDFKKYYAVVLDVNRPLSNRDYIDNVSTRGARFIYREYINNRFSVGGELGFATYNGHLPPQVYTNGNTSIYAELFTYTYNYTLSISGEYYFVEESWIKPFAGLGVGACYNNYTFYYNVFGDQDKVWGALFRPNAGVLMRFGANSRWGARISTHYDYSTTKSEDLDLKGLSNVGVDAGLALIFR